jgi:hypothetical protein
MKKKKDEYPILAKILIITFFTVSLRFFLSNWISSDILAPILAITAILFIFFLSLHDPKKK